MGRSPCCVKEGLNRGAWTSLEDKILTEYIKVHGEGKWRSLPKRAGLKRCGKSCRLRWLNYLRPDIKRGNITNDEEDLIIRLHKLLGNRWSLIAGRLPGRTDNEIKNYWNTNIGKRVQGHPSSSTTRKPSTRAGAKNLSSKAKVSGPPLPQKEGSYVVRTKASRCTKVFINAELDKTQQPGIMAMKGLNFINTEDDIEKNSKEPAPPGAANGTSPTLPREDNSSDFIIDFEMDDKFLSEFLQAESCVTPYDFDIGIADNLNPKEIPEDYSYPHGSCQNALFSGAQEAKQDSELGSMTSLLDPALDWLQDE